MAIVETTRVSPSQCPTDSPLNVTSGFFECGRPSVGTRRMVCGNSVRIQITPGFWMISIGPCSVAWVVIDVGVPPGAQMPYGVGYWYFAFVSGLNSAAGCGVTAGSYWPMTSSPSRYPP
jgi:hypothetical protein